jgi:ATP-dependent DNA helicase DinG
MNYTISVPSTVASGKEARHLLEQALALGLEPAPPPAHTVNLRKLSLYLPTTLTAQLEGHPSSLSRSDLIRGLVSAAVAQSNGQSAVASQGLPVNESRKWNLHRAQKDMVDTLLKGIRTKKIILLEGSTGIGKSRVIARAALKLPLSNPTIGIFAPTLTVLYQLVEEFFDTAKQECKIEPQKIAVYIGKRNFIDQEKLAAILPALEASAPEAAGRAHKWIKEGGPAVTDITKKLSKHTPLKWLVDDLVEVVPEISASSVGCDEFSKPCPGRDAYQESKAGLDQAHVIFSTQTMLCLNVVNDKLSLLPDFGAVFVDEAHQLEEAMANVTGSDLSIRHLHASLRDGYERKDVSSSRWKAIDALITECQEQLAMLPDDYLAGVGEEGDPPYKAFRQHAASLAKHLKEIKSDDDNWLKRIKNWHYTLDHIVSSNYEARVTFSPKLRLPSVTVGPSFLRRHFERLWDSCESACLLSATLYICERPGHFSSRFIRLKLCIPSERALETKPCIAPWIYNSPTLYSVDPDHAQAFTYPGGESLPLEIANWVATIARSIAILAKDATGGTLVLCNSYADVEALASHLIALKRRLIVQTRDDSVKTLTAVFKAAARDGKRPVWLATGPAWTGLNLRDELEKNASDDRILTDLVIARCPMGRNRTAAHRARREWLGFDQELLDMAFTLRQGFGRLIRREGLSDRRIWFLDGRIYTKRGTYQKVNALLRTYPHHGEKHAATTARP